MVKRPKVIPLPLSLWPSVVALAPCEGMIDFGRIISILSRLGPEEWLSVELLGGPDPDTAARLTLTHKRAGMEQ